MKMREYQALSAETAVYPIDPETHGASYLTLGLAGETGELANLIKKEIRDGPSAERRQAIREELGDVLWYHAQLCSALGIGMEVVAAENIRKLQGRKERGTLKGDGTR